MTDPRNDGLKWHAVANVHKFDEEAVRWLTEKLGREPQFADFQEHLIKPYEVGTTEKNLLTTAGLTRITSLIIGAGGQALTNTATRLGAGDGSGTAAVGDTDLSALSGATHRYFQPADATYPSVSGAVITIYATFGSANGNFAWNEWGADIGTPTVTGGTTVNATLLNHKTSFAQGTKTSGQAWTLQATITLS